jgi:hypothetical protein
MWVSGFIYGVTVMGIIMGLGSIILFGVPS